MNTIKAVQTPIFFLKPNRSMSYSSVIFFSFTLLNFLFYFMVFYVFLKSIFRKWTTKLSLAIFYKKKKACYNWNLRLLLLHMSLLHPTIWKYVNLLGREFIYDILRGGMAFIISTWASAQYFLAWATCW